MKDLKELKKMLEPKTSEEKKLRETAAKIAAKEVKNLISYKNNCLVQISEFKASLNDMAINQEIAILKELEKLPACIAGGDTWRAFARGLCLNRGIETGILNFYKSQYEIFKAVSGDEKPIWLLTSEKSLKLSNEYVIPTVVQVGNKKRIVLLLCV